MEQTGLSPGMVIPAVVTTVSTDHQAHPSQVYSCTWSAAGWPQVPRSERAVSEVGGTVPGVRPQRGARRLPSSLGRNQHVEQLSAHSKGGEGLPGRAGES